jgi:hypothetical protein
MEQREKGPSGLAFERHHVYDAVMTGLREGVVRDGMRLESDAVGKVWIPADRCWGARRIKNCCFSLNTCTNMFQNYSTIYYNMPMSITSTEAGEILLEGESE